MAIKPIETVYNGYRFRSRLEARWAVFFDVLGVKYEYEKEGYDLDGEWYLPDFYLPTWDTWLEVKPPDIPDLDAQRKAILLSLGKQNPEKYGDSFKLNMCVVCGSPWFPKLLLGTDGLKIVDGYFIMIPHLLPDPDSEPPVLVWSIECFKGDKSHWDIWPIYFPDDFSGIIDLKDSPVFSQNIYRSLLLPFQWMTRLYVGDGVSYSSDDLSNAYIAARQARFGKNGRG